MDRRCRKQLSMFFAAWLQQHMQLKLQWRKMIRARYVLGRKKAKRILPQWRMIAAFERKLRLNELLIIQRIWSYNQRQIFEAFREVTLFKKVRKQSVSQALRAVVLRHAFLSIKAKAREVLVLQNMHRIADDLRAKNHGNRDVQRQHLAIRSLRLQVQRRLRKNGLLEDVDDLRRRLLLSVHFRALRKFPKMQNKKLMQKRTLNAYLTEDRPLKMQERIVEALRRNLHRKLRKQGNMRKAMKFNLMRTQKYYRMVMAWRMLKLNV